MRKNFKYNYKKLLGQKDNDLKEFLDEEYKEVLKNQF